MDKELLKQAIAADDQVRADFQEWESQRAQQQQIVRKDFSDLRTSAPSQQQEPSASTVLSMTPEQQAPWDKWCNAMIDERTDVYMGYYSEAVNKNTEKFNKNIRALFEAVDALEAERAELRAEIEHAQRQSAINNYEIASLRKELADEVEAVRAAENNRNGYQG